MKTRFSKTCFSIMPLGNAFKDISETIKLAARECHMEYTRGDMSDKAGSIMPQILHDIRSATVVVADISGHNPNVLYELGIAHQIKGPERVVIITQEVNEKKAYDLHQYRQLVYDHNADGLEQLLKDLPVRLNKAAEASADHEFWNVVRGRLPRTRLLVRDLQRLLERKDSKDLKHVTIRIAAGLSSIAISENEPGESKSNVEYRKALIAERDALRNVLLRGARLKAVLNPPRRQAMLPERLRTRYERLIGLLEGRSDIKRRPKVAAADVRAMRQCEFVISPVPMPNMFIIGEEVAYEGMKRAGTGGFEMTHCETSGDGLRELIEQFDRFFEETRREMLRAHPPDGQLLKQMQDFYREATRLT